MQLQKFLFRLAALCALLSATEIAQAASLEVYVTNVRPTKTVYVSVYKDAQTWAEGREPVVTRVIAARGPTQTIRIDGLVPGRYAVRVHQDPNGGDGSGFAEPPSFALARDGLSGNGSRYGIPHFDRAAVNVGAEGARSTIHLFTASHF